MGPNCLFWATFRDWPTDYEATFFGVRVFNPYHQAYAVSYRLLSPQTIFETHDRQKRRQYEERIREVEGASFTPLVFSSTGATERISEAFLKRLASLLSDQRNTTYSETMAWLRCRLSFALLRANVLCLRGTRGRERLAETTTCATVALAEAQVSWHWGGRHIMIIWQIKPKQYPEHLPYTLDTLLTCFLFCLVFLYLYLTHISPHIVLICALQFADFLRLCLSPRTTSRTISFSISNSFWY